MSCYFLGTKHINMELRRTHRTDCKKKQQQICKSTNTMVCVLQTLTQEGPLKFYTGFPTYYIRIAPHVALTLVFAAELPKWQKTYLGL